jgi:hypothetical protein
MATDTTQLPGTPEQRAAAVAVMESYHVEPLIYLMLGLAIEQTPPPACPICGRRLRPDRRLCQRAACAQARAADPNTKSWR